MERETSAHSRQADEAGLRNAGAPKAVGEHTCSSLMCRLISIGDAMLQEQYSTRGRHHLDSSAVKPHSLCLRVLPAQAGCRYTVIPGAIEYVGPKVKTRPQGAEHTVSSARA